MSRHITGFTTPEGMWVGVEWIAATHDSDGYILALYPDEELWPDRMDPESAPAAWKPLMDAAVSYMLTGGN